MNILESIGGRRELLALANELENPVMTGKIAGSRSRGRPRKKYLDRINETIGGGITT